MTFSASQEPFGLEKRTMLLESVAPTNPCSESGSCCQRISSGISPSSPRSMVWVLALRSRSQKWSLRPYLPSATSAGLKPSLKVFGAAHSEEIRVLARGWYQKSYMNSTPSDSLSQRPRTEKSLASSTAKPAGVLPSASPSIEMVTMSPGMQWTVCGPVSPVLPVSSSGSITRSISGLRGSDTSTMWIREERKPGTISLSRARSEWHADEQAFQPKWCSSSPTLGIGVRWTISE